MEKKDLEYTNTAGLTIIESMGLGKRVRTVFSTLFVCVASILQVHAGEEIAPIKEWAQLYLEHPTCVSHGGCYPIDSPCGNCGQCEACEIYWEGEATETLPTEPFVPVSPPVPPQSQRSIPPKKGRKQKEPAPTTTSSTITPLISSKVPLYKKPSCSPAQDGYTVNFEDVAVIQLIKFISQISGVNFIFDCNDLRDPQGTPHKITLVSEGPTQVSDLSAALLQILNMYGLSVVEQGNNVLIYRSQNLSKVSTVITDENVDDSCENAVITRVFQLYNVDPERIAAIVRTLVSPAAVVDPSVETRHLIVTDITANVNKIADLLSALDTPTLPIDVAEYQVKNANVVTLAEYAARILSPIAGTTPLNITPEPASQKVFVVGSPILISRAMQLFSSLDVAEITAINSLPPPAIIENNHFYVYKLKHKNGLDIAEALHDIGSNLQYAGIANIELVNAIYSAQWVDVNNSIVITGTGIAIKKVVDLLDILDELPKQVYFEVLVLDVALENSLDFGVQWIALGDEQNKLAFATGLLANGNTLQSSADAVAAGTSTTPATVPPPAVPSPANITLPTPGNLVGFSDIVNATEAFSLGILGNIISHNGRSFLTLGALLSALDEQEDTKVVINPKIMVEDGQPANFFVGQNIPYQTTSTVIQQTGSVTQNIQYEDIGVQLQVTPTIAPDNVVTLQINQTVASIQGTPGATLTPVTNKELVTTRVHVPDGTFLVMSGHVQETCSYIHSGVPCLGSLPLIGPAFSRTIEQRQRRNLIFFIRPKVITNHEEGVILTNEEGYDYNWGSDPCSLIESDCPCAPECETYPNPCWPPNYATMPGGECAPFQESQPQPLYFPRQAEQPPPQRPSLPPVQSFPRVPYYLQQSEGAEEPEPPSPYQGRYPSEYSEYQAPPADYQPAYDEYTPAYAEHASPYGPLPQGNGEYPQPSMQTLPNYIQTTPGYTQPNSERATGQSPYHTLYPGSGVPGTYPEYSDY